MAAAVDLQLTNKHLSKLQVVIMDFRESLKHIPEDPAEYDRVLDQLDVFVDYSSLLLEEFATIEHQLQDEILQEDDTS